MSRLVFIGEQPLESLKESTESFILNCAREAIGEDYFVPYYREFGTCGLGKTYELCLRLVISKNPHGFKIIKTDAKSKIDIVLRRGKKIIGLQVKTGKEYKKTFGLSRIDEIVSDDDKDIGSNSYIKGLEAECKELSIDLCYVLYVSTSDGVMHLRKFCRMENGSLVMESDDEYTFNYSQKHTVVRMDQDRFPLVGKRHFDPLVYKEPVFDKPKRDTDQFELERLCLEISRNFKKFDKLVLGKNWGDKGFACEKFVIDTLRSKGIDIVRLKVRDISDAYVAGVGLIQIKYYDTKQSQNSMKVFCRSSKKDGDIIEIDCEWLENVKHHIVPDNTEVRKTDIENRIKSSLIENKQTSFYLLEIDGYRTESSLYHLSDLCEDGTLKHKGSFLRKNHYNSSGGKNGNQSHFRIKTKNLIKIEDFSKTLFDDSINI